MGISKTDCSRSITKQDLENRYVQGIAEGALASLKCFRNRLTEHKEQLMEEFRSLPSGSDSDVVCTKIYELNIVMEKLDVEIKRLTW